MTETSQTPAKIALELLTESGLTPNQLGRLMDSGPRAAHLWAAGGRISPRNEERLRELGSLIFGLDATTGEERRRLMLDSSNGPSLFRKFQDSYPQAQRIQFTLPVEVLLGLDHSEPVPGDS